MAGIAGHKGWGWERDVPPPTEGGSSHLLQLLEHVKTSAESVLVGSLGILTKFDYVHITCMHTVST